MHIEPNTQVQSWSQKFPKEGNDKLLHYSCMENPWTERQAMIHTVAQVGHIETTQHGTAHMQ